MGRPRIYRSEEEKVLANRAKSKRHYDKSKETINKQRRRIYKRLHRSKQQTRSTHDSNPISKCVERAAQITESLNQLHAGESLVKFFDNLVINYTSGQDLNAAMVNNFANELSRLHTSAIQVESDIIQIAKIGAESNMVGALVARLRTLTHCVEEILCEVILEEKAGLWSAYTAKKLMYQGLSYDSMI